jgi:hypothetical protein
MTQAVVGAGEIGDCGAEVALPIEVAAQFVEQPAGLRGVGVGRGVFQQSPCMRQDHPIDMPVRGSVCIQIGERGRQHGLGSAVGCGDVGGLPMRGRSGRVCE